MRLFPIAAATLFVALAGCSAGPSPEEAKASLSELKSKGRLDDISETNFVYCAFMSDRQAVGLYLASGMSPNVRNQFGRTPLIAAAAAEPQSPWYSKNAEIVKLLVDKGADVSAKDSSGDSALKLAAAQNRGQIAQLLRDAGARE